MKKIFLLTMASLMTVFAMAVGRNDGSTKANAKEFDWDKGVTIPQDSINMWLWYRVPLTPLYEEENPSLTLYLTNPSNAVGTSVDVNMKADVAGQSESKDYTIAARQYKTYTANAKMLVTLRQTEIYVQLKATGVLKFSAKVYESADLDETCKDARTLAWETETTQNPSYSAWWKVSLKPIKNVEGYDAQVTLTNTGSKTVNLKIGQSLDCPSSGVTKREYTLASGESIVKKIPRDMITSVQPDELYFGVENVESKVSIKVEKVAQPPVPVIPAATLMPGVNLLVTDTIEPMPVGQTLYKISVADMDSLAKYEPEFTYRNAGSTPAHVKIQMAFSRPAFSTSDTEYDLAAGDEEIVVYKKNMLEGMEGVDSIYLLTTVTGDVNFYGRFKHVREGKACKTNIPFNWEGGHTQEARTTQWYAVDVTEARDRHMDIIVSLLNLNEVGGATASVKASMAFSCPYIDVQELTRSVKADGKVVTRRLAYSTYGMLSDVIYIGLETNQPLKFWADTVPTKTKEPDEACLTAKSFDWEQGVLQEANDTVWYVIAMDSVRTMAAKFPTVYVHNLGDAEAAITAELSLECPDSIANQKRSIKIAANGTFSKQLSRNLFENISQDTVYLRVISTQQVHVQVRLTEEAEGTSCASAIPFNWVSGNSQAANANLWYYVDLRDVMERGNDLKLHIQNKDNETCNGVLQLAYSCPDEGAPSIQEFKLAGKAEKTVKIQNSALETLQDSIVYINLRGNTALRFWADTLKVKPYDTISGEGLTLIPLQWDSLYTQSVDTAWYIIPKSEIEKVRNMDDKVTPVVHVINLGNAETTIKGEAAFAFPIVKSMMTKNLKLKANQHYKDTVMAGTFEQFIKKDSIIIRVTRPVGSADFQFSAQLVKAFNGNDRKTAIPLQLGKLIEQSANTAMWYKVNTADWKKNRTLYDKSMIVFTKNVGTITADIKVEAYDGYDSDVNLLETQGDIRSPKGEIRQRTFPGQVIYGLGDVEIYFRVSTTDTLIFYTEVQAQYAAQPYDPAQADAKLLVPNVDYVIPGDNQEHWYRVCLPYIRNNYKYTHASTLTYELDGKATIEATATLDDSLAYALPVRKRTINTAGKHYKGEKPLSELLAKAVKKGLHRSLDITTFEESYVDSMLRRFVTSDSISGYVRIKTDKDIKARINLLQTTGDDCYNAMPFDWEHGNVNPKGETTWYKVSVDSTMIPDTCDIRLHLDNWSAGVSKSTADLQFTCEEQPTTITKTIQPNGKEWKDISRDYLAKMQWPKSLFIQYTSDSTTHIWIEFIKHVEPAPHCDTITTFVCYGDTVWDLNNNPHVIESDKVLIDTLFDLVDSVKAQLYDSILVDSIFVKRNPQLYKIDDQLTIKRNEVLDVTAADTWLKGQYATAHNDTLKKVKNIIWQYSTDGTNYIDIPASLKTDDKLSSKWINVKYTAELDCDDHLESIYLNSVKDTVPLDTTYCHTFSYYWAPADTTLTAATVDPLPFKEYHKSFMGDSISYLLITLAELPAKTEFVTIQRCNFYEWELADTTIYNSGDYTYILECGASNGGDSIVKLHLTIDHPQIDTLPAVAKYGNRLLMIDRNAINNDPNIKWDLDSISDMNYVTWYKMVGAEPNPEVDQELKGEDGKPWHDYYYTNVKTGNPLVGDFYARIDIPASDSNCGYIGTTVVLHCPAANAAPALTPTLARPGQDIQVLHLDPNAETVIRVYSTQGLKLNQYIITGQETYTIKAAAEFGYYLVEVYNDSQKVTLRYIVK